MVASMQQEDKKIIRDPQSVAVKRALISVSDKTDVVEFARKLNENYGVEILSTGGTFKKIQEAGIEVTEVSDYTGFPEMMDGRVKTLHPKIHGGILALRDEESHAKALNDHEITPIDLVAVNLYPFMETVKSGADFETCIENIDIGGPSMVRSAAKNHRFVTIATSPADYALILKNLEKYEGHTTASLRRELAEHAFSHVANYDSAIANWFAEQNEDTFPPRKSFHGNLKTVLRYGENPHQKAALYADDTNRPGLVTAKQLQGKELSYNNINDADAAFECVSEFSEPAVAIIKHANPCGVAVSDDIAQAYRNALQCDPVSAFGGIIALNRTITKEVAEEVVKIFSEVIIAPSVETDALDIFAQKERLRVLTTGDMIDPHAPRSIVKSISGGYLIQDADNGVITLDDLKTVTDREPTQEEMEDLLFAFNVCKHVKSNAIIFAKDQATVGIGAGQMSRIDSTRIAALKSEDATKAAGLLEPMIKGSVVASDAFFPFADGLLAAADAGATAIIQPGGSMRDEEVIEAANQRGIAMVFTGMRHFKH